MINLISRTIAALQLKLYRPELHGPFSIDYRERLNHERARCVSHTVYLAHVNNKGETRGSSRYRIIAEE